MPINIIVNYQLKKLFIKEIKIEIIDHIGKKTKVSQSLKLSVHPLREANLLSRRAVFWMNGYSTKSGT